MFIGTNFPFRLPLADQCYDLLLETIRLIQVAKWAVTQISVPVYIHE